MLVTVPVHGPGDSVGDVRFLDASCIPLLVYPKPYALAALQVRPRQYSVALPSSMYTQILVGKWPSFLNFITQGRSKL